jgi:hypothetical protein
MRIALYTGMETWIYKGKEISKELFETYKLEELKGNCPICHRTGLTNKYGSMKKHIKACINKEA